MSHGQIFVTIIILKTVHLWPIISFVGHPDDESRERASGGVHLLKKARVLRHQFVGGCLLHLIYNLELRFRTFETTKCFSNVQMKVHHLNKFGQKWQKKDYGAGRYAGIF